MNVKECYEAFGGDYQDVISRLRTDERVARFLEKVKNDGSFALLCESVEKRNMAEAFRAAHTLKGVCMNLSLTRLYTSSSNLTELLRGREEYSEEIEPLLARVKQDYAHTVHCIEQLQI